MLERATTCLDSGARFSAQQCTRRGLRSRRLLHSTFWTHGAGDLDLPPWALPSAAPRAKSSKHDDLGPHGDREKKRRLQSSNNSDNPAPFLDFLYPPQALNWLHTTIGKGGSGTTATNSQWDKWERRNARRLADGLVQPSRRYTSKSRSKLPAMRSLEREEEREPSNIDELLDQDEKHLEFQADNSDPEKHNEMDAVFFEEISSGSDRNTQYSNMYDLDKNFMHSRDLNQPDRNTEPIDDTSHETDVNAPLYNTSPGTYSNEDRESGLEALEAAILDERAKRSEWKNNDIELEPDDWANQTVEVETVEEPPKAKSKIHHLEKSYSHELPQFIQRKLREAQFIEESEERGIARDVLASEAWKSFSTLAQEQQDNLTLKIEMLQLFAQFKSAVAAKHYTALLKSIPRTKWTYTLIQPLMEMHLHQRRFGQVFMFHYIATTNLAIDDAIPITTWLLLQLIGQRQWDHAIQTLAQAGQAPQQYRQRLYDELPTLLREKPKMFTLACSFTRYIDRQDSRKQSSLQDFNVLVIQSGLRHLVRNGLSLYNDPLRMPYVRKMLSYLRANDSSVVDFFNYLIWKTVSPSYKAMQDIEVYRLLSAVMHNYKDIEGAKPSESLLLSLQRWMERYSKLHHIGAVSSRLSLSLDEIVRAWERYYSRPSLNATKSLLAYYAFQGNVEQVNKWKAALREFGADYHHYKETLRSIIYVHARRGDIKAAERALAEVKDWAAENDDVPDLACFNALIFAHLRADDAQGAIKALLEIITTTEFDLDAKSVQPVMELLAKRGDVQGVQELAQQFNHLSGHSRTTAMVGSLINAHVNVGETETAENLLEEALKDMKAGKIEGSLTTCFNIIITAHALRRDFQAATDTYRWMQAEGIKPNGDTFAALMQALVTFRKSDAALKILRKVMPSIGLKPSAFHYAIVLTGYINQGILTRSTFEYIKQHMVKNKVKSSIGTEIAFRKAEILRQQRHSLRSSNLADQTIPLENIIEELEKAVERARRDETYERQRPLPGLSLPDTAANALAARYDLLIEVHGSRLCFQAVKRVYSHYMNQVRRHGLDEDAIPMRMMSALMSAYVKAGQYSEVERCWQFVKNVADKLTQPSEIPSLSNKPVTIDQFGRLPLVDNKRRRLLNSGADGGSSGAIQATIPVRGRQNVLSRPLQYLIEARAAESRLPSAVTIASNLLSQGYTFDNTTWNYFIETLCRAQPPYTLLAFVLAERFLMPNWPNWKYHREPFYPLKRSEVKQGLEHIRARYLAPGQLMPFYRTLVWMGRALLELRDHDAGVADWTVAKDMEGYVGSLDRVKSRAPMALLAVQEMPRMSDELQEDVLKGERLHNLG